MPLAHYYDVDREHSTKYKNSHCLLNIRKHAEYYKNTNRWRARKITVHELTLAIYVVATSHSFCGELNPMSLRYHYEENQLNIFFK